jgi:hypothetical protein
MALLRSYGVSSVDSLTFLAEFEIPDNCFYTVTKTDGVYWIEIELNPGQTYPSKDSIMEKENFVTTDGELDLQFKQIESGTTNIKPKVKVTQL